MASIHITCSEEFRQEFFIKTFIKKRTMSSVARELILNWMKENKEEVWNVRHN